MKVCKICCVVGCKTVECKSGWCQWHHVHAAGMRGFILMCVGESQVALW